MDVWLILTFIFTALMAFSMGANDAANGLATSYGSKALSLKFLILGGALAEFFGAMFCAGAVTGTLSVSIIPSLDDTSTI